MVLTRHGAVLPFSFVLFVLFVAKLVIRFPKNKATKSTKSAKIPKENHVMGYAQIPSEDEAP